jgi:hypothetical protein
MASILNRNFKKFEFMLKMLVVAFFVNGLFSGEPKGSDESKDSELERESERKIAAKQEILHYSIEARCQEIDRLTIKLKNTEDKDEKETCNREIKGHLDHFINTYGECDD